MIGAPTDVLPDVAMKPVAGGEPLYLLYEIIDRLCQAAVAAVLDDFIVASLTPNVNKTKFMGVCKYTKGYPIRRIDIRYVDKERLAFAMLYFTGSGEFNMKMRSYALKKGYSINEYAIKDKKTGVEVSGIKTERDIFKFLGLSYVPPAKRVPDYKFPEV